MGSLPLGHRALPGEGLGQETCCFLLYQILANNRGSFSQACVTQTSRKALRSHLSTLPSDSGWAAAMPQTRLNCKSLGLRKHRQTLAKAAARTAHRRPGRACSGPSSPATLPRDRERRLSASETCFTGHTSLAPRLVPGLCATRRSHPRAGRLRQLHPGTDFQEAQKAGPTRRAALSARLPWATRTARGHSELGKLRSKVR